MTAPDICLVSASGGSAFMEELLEVVADAVRGVGGRARTAVGAYPEAASDTVYVVVPHEYFVLTPDESQPGVEDCRRTIGFCVEHPGTATFERNATLVRSLAAAVDINHDSTAELRRRGVAVEHFQLGYSPLWDVWGGDLDSPREVDVTYLGTAERRRSQLLSSYWRDLDALRVRLLTPPHEMMVDRRVDFLPGKEKFEHLARSRFILNLHREQKQTFEWVRALEAMSNGCVLVSEPSADLDPLMPGEHLVIARPQTLGTVAAALAGQPERERQLRAAAYEFVRKLDLPGSARMLVEMARSIVSGASAGPPVESAPGAVAAGMRSPVGDLAIDTPSWDTRFHGSAGVPAPASSVARAVQLGQRTVAARRGCAGEWSEPLSGKVFPEVERSDVDVLVVRRPGEPDPDPLVRDLLAGTVLPGQVLVADDGVGPVPAARPYRLLRNTSPIGCGTSRNALLGESTASWLLVLDAGMRASRYLLERLLGASGEVDVVHTPVGDPVSGLVGALPPESRRLATLPYLGTGYLVRREVVEGFGGWTEDPLLDGLTDHVFWRQVCAGDHPSALVQQVLLRRVRPEPPQRPLDLDPHRVWTLANTAVPHVRA
ncbi:hypothetical protein CFN78_27295 [Amycolatopsis antarctica]|uniref:Spore protein YkvP/CgeB glycosyl transferase-like domain-containing protein n=1 Tax=Amycolatopsis antarctica TaxID=1854586 RepID=A0A263CVA9_9PSEU|nr:glycosyltransferase [Amycolatopsis antarctica]OZM70041.1 hypothetical protein CFN78_27295 [Amycolatopsis antarctica]